MSIGTGLASPALRASVCHSIVATRVYRIKNDDRSAYTAVPPITAITSYTSIPTLAAWSAVPAAAVTPKDIAVSAVTTLTTLPPGTATTAPGPVASVASVASVSGDIQIGAPYTHVEGDGRPRGSVPAVASRVSLAAVLAVPSGRAYLARSRGAVDGSGVGTFSRLWRSGRRCIVPMVLCRRPTVRTVLAVRNVSTNVAAATADFVGQDRKVPIAGYLAMIDYSVCEHQGSRIVEYETAAARDRNVAHSDDCHVWNKLWPEMSNRNIMIRIRLQSTVD